MQPKFVLTFHSFILLLVGAVTLLLPQSTLSVVGVTLDPAALHIIQFTGVGMLCIGLLAWVARHLPDGNTLHEIYGAFLLLSLLAFGVALVAQVMHMVNWLGWLAVVINLLLALNYAYFLAGRAEASESPTLTHRHQH